MKDILNGFKDFIARGNAIDLAVGVVIGSAFGAVVTSITEGLLNPIIAALFGKPNLDNVLSWDINNAHFSIGMILTALINFLFIAAAVYFFIVVPINKLRSLGHKNEVPAPPVKPDDVVLLEQIRDLLARQQGTTPPAPKE